VAKRRKPIVIDVPTEDPNATARPDAESRAVAEHPEFRALIAGSRRRSAAGERGRPAEEVFRELGLTEDGEASGEPDTGNGHPAPARRRWESSAPAAPAYRVKAVIRRDSRYLLAQHNNRRPENQGRWTFLGGLIDPDDASPSQALIRELREELRVTGRVTGEVGWFPYQDNPGPCLVLLADFEGEPRPNEEILALRWYTRAEVEALGRAGLLQMGLELEAIAQAERLSALNAG
jgi:8-oxo-dGTP pyrophosphatase MutT (NUDIX family)